MHTPPLRPPGRDRAPLAGRHNDDGFTLVEVLIALAVVGIVMGAVTTFFSKTMSATNQQRGRQVATQLADDAAEQVRALTGSSLAVGRTQGNAEPAEIVPGVAAYLTDLQQWNDAAGTPVLPVVPVTVRVNGVSYVQHWYLGKCWRSKAADGNCTAVTGPGLVEYFRVVVAVTWPDKMCTANTCSYVSATLVSNADSEPIFNLNGTAQPPAVENPGDQASDVTVPVNLLFNGVGGAPPLTWSATGLPPGLVIDSSGLVTGTPTTAGAYAVVVRATDANALTGSAGFTWTVNPKPDVTRPAPQNSVAGTAVSLPMVVTGGTAPFVWSATGLPAGLAIDPASGMISGTPTAAVPATPVTVTVSDKYAQTAFVTFPWTVAAAPAPSVKASTLSVQTPESQTNRVGIPSGTLHIRASGGVPAYTYAMTGQPPGLTIDSKGKITGTPGARGTYQVTVTVTDAAGASASTNQFTWTVTS
jgi:prepilin-type N-terminal cleavage/methylation domain-containing protein